MHLPYSHFSLANTKHESPSLSAHLFYCHVRTATFPPKLAFRLRNRLFLSAHPRQHAHHRLAAKAITTSHSDSVAPKITSIVSATSTSATAWSPREGTAASQTTISFLFLFVCYLLLRPETRPTCTCPHSTAASTSLAAIFFPPRLCRWLCIPSPPACATSQRCTASSSSSSSSSFASSCHA